MTSISAVAEAHVHSLEFAYFDKFEITVTRATIPNYRLGIYAPVTVIPDRMTALKCAANGRNCALCCCQSLSVSD